MARTKAHRAADAELPPESSGGGSALASIEAAADSTSTPRDPEEAAQRLAGGAQGDADDFELQSEAVDEVDTPKARRGRPRGSVTGTRKSRSGSKHPTRADLKERAEKAEARLAQLEGANAPDREQQLAELANAIGGAVSMMTDMWVAGKPEREGWRWKPEEAERIGQLWAAPLLPHMPALGAAAPWVMATFGTASLAMEKARNAREVAAKVKAAPELAPAAEEVTP